ncbi:MAG: hypothetical protein OXF79_28910 [Chloroflexi bacterium]|nr:hypothetical protein [Chloroflexota bacterium]
MLTVQWVEEEDSYVRLLSIPDVLPVMLPDNSGKRLRWRTVLSELYDPKTRGNMSDYLIVGVGPIIEDIARALCLRSGAGLASCPTLATALPEIEGSRYRRILVLGLASQLRSEWVHQLITRAHSLDKQVGFLAGRDLPGLSFSLAKTLQTPGQCARGMMTFDAIDHVLDHDRADVPALRQALTNASAVKIIRSHGEGSHAKLRGLTVCGLLEPREFADTPHIGCAWDQNHCKRAPDRSGRSVVFGKDIKTPVVFILCCNAFNFASELYPSNVSLSLSLTESWASAVIAPIRPIIAPNVISVSLAERVAEGGTVGEIVNQLNASSLRINQGVAFALHGDPAQTIEPSRSVTAESETQCDELSFREESSNPSQIRQLQDWICGVLAQLHRIWRLMASAECAGLDTQLSDLREKLQCVQKLALYALKQSETVISQSGQNDLVRKVGLVKGFVGQVDRQLAKTIADARKVIDPYDLFHYDLVRLRLQEGLPCDRCLTAVEISIFGRGESKENQRRAVLCPVCGPKSEHRVGGFQLSVRHSIQTTALTGSHRLIIWSAVSSESSSVVPFATVAVRFVDKALDKCIVDLEFLCAVNGEACVRTVDLPLELSADLHSIRIVASCGLDLAYGRFRLEGGPLLDQAAASAKSWQ